MGGPLLCVLLQGGTRPYDQHLPCLEPAASLWPGRNFTIGKLALNDQLLRVFQVARVDHRFHKATLCGAAGYKGSIGIRLVYKDSTSMAFVTSHLTHAESTYKRRLQVRRELRLREFT